MVFSIFKKQEKEVSEHPESVTSPRGAGVRPDDALPSPNPAEKTSPSDLSQSFVFSEVFPIMQLDAEIDPVEAQAEEVAILFSDGQNDAAASALESAVRTLHTAPAERLWWMLFDLYALTGKQAAFEALGINYAQFFGQSPPIWRASLNDTKAVQKTAETIVFKGDLVENNEAAFLAIRRALEKSPRLRLNLSKIAKLDLGGCARLLSLLQRAKKSARAIELLGHDALEQQLQPFIEIGLAENQECWLLFLELCQRQGQHAVFEEMAINYAVTFEVSPPSWEVSSVASPEPVIAQSAPAETMKGDLHSEAYELRDEIKAFRFEDFPTYAKGKRSINIDCSALKRMDFVSAGVLLNMLSTLHKQGKNVVFHSPNHLVAELFNVVGLTAFASIVYPKH